MSARYGGAVVGRRLTGPEIPWEEPVELGSSARQTRDVGDVAKGLRNAAGKTALGASGVGSTYYLGTRMGPMMSLQRNQRKGRERAKAEREKVTKARYYDPEHRRQRHVGEAVGAGALGGALLASHGGRGIARETKALRALPTKVVHQPPSKLAGAVTSRPLRDNDSGRSAISVSRRNAAYVGGGTVALSGAGALNATANNRRSGIRR